MLDLHGQDALFDFVHARRIEQCREVAAASSGKRRFVLDVRIEFRAVSQNRLTGPWPPGWSQTHAATVPPGVVTRAISRSAITGSAMK